MESKEKAKELVERFSYEAVTTDGDVFHGLPENHRAKQCALICVDEILEAFKVQYCNSNYISCYDRTEDEWQEVKQEIENL